MTTSPNLTSLTEETTNEFTGPIPGITPILIDRPDTNFNFAGAIKALQVTASGHGSSVSGYGDIGEFILMPYADNIDGWLMGGVKHLQTTNNWFADLTIVGDVMRADMAKFDYSDATVYGNVGVLELFDSRDSDLAFYGQTDQADVTWVQDTALTFNKIEGSLELDGVTDSVVKVREADDASINIDNAADLAVSMYSADDTLVKLDEVDNLDLSVETGGVIVAGEGVENSSIQTGHGHDYLTLDDAFGSTVDTGSGNDSVMLQDADQVALRTGDGNDFLSFTTADPTAQVAYNPGAGNDFGIISGGNTFGVMDDGERDKIFFDAGEGGKHEVFADEKDQLIVQTPNGGSWDATLIDFVDQGGQDGKAELGDFSLTMHTPAPDTLSSDAFLG